MLRNVSASLLVGMLVMALPVSAQNTILPPPIQTFEPTFWADDVFATQVPGFVFGYQWGAAYLDKVNTALKINVTSQNWGYIDGFRHELHKLGRGLGDTNYLVWASPLVSVPGNEGLLFSAALYGMRWEPAEVGGLSRTWQPRDEESWPLSFEVRQHGTVPSDPGDVNYRRFVLDTAGLASHPMRVLDSVQPRNCLAMHCTVDWEDPMEEKFVATVNGSDTTFLEDTTNGRRMQLVINLRRADTADTDTTDLPVLTVEVPYFMRWKHQQDTSNLYQPNRQLMTFVKVPVASASEAFALPLGRGLELPLREPPVARPTSVVITKRMLPVHGTPGGPDITIVAEFVTDSIMYLKVEGGDTSYPRREHMLKTGRHDYPVHTLSDSVLLESNIAGYNKRYMAIDTMGVTVWYHGNAAVTVRSVSLVTPLTKRITSGYCDSMFAAQFADEREDIATLIDEVEDTTGRTLRLLAYYTNDEFDIDQLLGMRYKLAFLDGRLTVETGFKGSRYTGNDDRSEYGRQKLHGWPSKFPWTSGTDHPSRQTAVPYMARTTYNESTSITNQPLPAPLLKLKYGYRWADTLSPFRRYETDVESPYYGPYEHLSLPFPTTPNDYLATPVYESYLHSNNASIGPATNAERCVYLNVYQTGDWYFSKRRYFWTNFFYHLDPQYGFDDNGRPWFGYRTYRPLTGAEVRLGHGLAVNLGTRGFMYDKFKHQDNLSRPQDTNYVMPLPAEVDTVTNYGKVLSKPQFYPGYVTEDSVAFVMDTLPDSVVSPDSLLRSEHLGGDYYTTSDRLKVYAWAPLDTLAQAMELSRFMDGTLSEKIYVGRRSVRWETKWWHDLVTDTVTHFRLGTGPSNATLFFKTRPVAWFGKGIKTLTGGDLARLRLWVDAYVDSVRVQRLRRASATDTTLVYEDEPAAEQLYDVVLLDTTASGVSDTFSIVAITNRRTNPLLFNASLPDSVEWISSYEHDQLTRGSRPELRYRQVGARRLTIPFHYQVDQSTPYLLHVRELVPSYDSTYAIDTILSGTTTLTVDLRPGQTRYLAIERLRATDTTGTGYLAFSTQSKLVAYPVLKADGTGYSDLIRYHLVYHRRDDDEQRGNPWTVYYQRSRPYRRDSLPSVAGLEWEAPLRLSRLTTVSTPSTDGQSRTRYYGIDSAAYEAAVDDTAGVTRDCCCGFPSVVVRDTAANKPVVFVVYACEDQWANAGQRGNYFHIVENVFADEAILDAEALEEGGRSLVIAGKDIGHDRPADAVPPIEDYLSDTLGSLARYGTPVINASADYRQYYAWSAADVGIGVGTKDARQQWFAGPTSLAEVPMPTIVGQPIPGDTTTVTIAGGEARYPSLNVYSNLAQGRSDATLVWQEGTNNRHIRYTRLVPGLGDAIARMLPDFVDLSYDSGTPPPIPVDLNDAVAVIGGALPTEEAELPVVVRSLQPDTLEMFIRDADGTPTGLYRYNHESVVWSEWLTGENRSQVRYHHMIDMTGFAAPQLHYWWVNTTGSTGGMSLFHPVVTQGALYLDSLTWQGLVGDSLITYADSLHIVHGNLSDSALVVNYTLLGGGDHQQVRAAHDALYASYWTGQGYFDNLLTQQITVPRMPPVPAPPQVVYHWQYLQAGGAWPHLAMREHEQQPPGLASVRRVLQLTSDDAPSLVASAEQLYKVSQQDRGTLLHVAASGGFHIGQQRLSLRAVFDDGTTVHCLPVYPKAQIPRGFAGSPRQAWQMQSMQQSPTELVSEVFTVGSHRTMKLLTTGTLRNNVTVTIEEVKASDLTTGRDGKRAYASFVASDKATALTLIAPSAAKADALQRKTYYLTNGEEKFYRLRMTYRGRMPAVYREDVDIDPDQESFSRLADASLEVVDLQQQQTTTLATTTAPLIYPNPSRGSVTVIATGGKLTAQAHGNAPLLLEVINTLGEVVITRPVHFAEIVHLHELPAGAYTVHIIQNDATMASHAVGQFVVIK